MIDASNLAKTIPIIGNEYIRLALKTPTMDADVALIKKTFKIYSVTDRMMISDSGKQSYIVHFCSPEMFIDILSPTYRTYEGQIVQVVRTIYKENIGETTPLQVLAATPNEVRFTSPGWRPFQCINWLASKAQGLTYKNPGALFFESNKSYWFANVEGLIDLVGRGVYQEYSYTPRMLNPDQNMEGGREGYERDIEQDYRKVEDFRVVQSFNSFKNVQNGYYANRLITLDMFSKDYKIYDYDHVASYGEYKHLENIAGTSNDDCAPFSRNTLRSPAGFVHFYPRHQQLYTDFKNNVQDVIETTLPRRISTMNELTNFKIEITVPGRTDIEIGRVVRFVYPDASPRSNADKNKQLEDDLFSGYYLVTAIRHKFTLSKHMMTLEMVKDSLKRRPQ